MIYPKIYFDEKLHRYTDEYGNVFTSVTTVIGKYVEEFDTEKMAEICEKIGKNPSHPKYLKYRNKTKRQLIKEWASITREALDKGNRRHNYLEDAIKSSNNYKRVKGKFINDRIFTIPDIIKNPLVGVVTLDKLKELGLDSRYPIIFNIIESFVNDGWKLYAEIGVYNLDYLVSGLIDLLLVKDNDFFIIDWKTNKAPIKFDSGYFEKDVNGNLTDKFIIDGKVLKYPLNHIPASTGHKYSLQLSGYAHLTELFGLNYVGTILCHIRDIDNKEVVELVKMKYLKNEIKSLFEHHISNLILVNQKKLFA